MQCPRSLRWNATALGYLSLAGHEGHARNPSALRYKSAKVVLVARHHSVHRMGQTCTPKRNGLSPMQALDEAVEQIAIAPPQFKLYFFKLLVACVATVSL